MANSKIVDSMKSTMKVMNSFNKAFECKFAFNKADHSLRLVGKDFKNDDDLVMSVWELLDIILDKDFIGSDCVEESFDKYLVEHDKTDTGVVMIETARAITRDEYRIFEQVLEMISIVSEVDVKDIAGCSVFYGTRAIKVFDVAEGEHDIFMRDIANEDYRRSIWGMMMELENDYHGGYFFRDSFRSVKRHNGSDDFYGGFFGTQGDLEMKGTFFKVQEESSWAPYWERIDEDAPEEIV
jgi:hypothetical protein